MCGIAGILNLRRQPVANLGRALGVMGDLLAHRGPDGSGQWQSRNAEVGVVHRRLSIIDLSEAAAQPMVGANGAVLVHNGEIYNYRELRESLAAHWPFKSHS